MFVQQDCENKYKEIGEEIMIPGHRFPGSTICFEFMSRRPGENSEHLKGTGHRTYLWVLLMLDVIEDKIVAYDTENSLKNIINQLPDSVDEAYERILSKSKEYRIARKLLLIIIATKRAHTVAQ